VAEGPVTIKPGVPMRLRYRVVGHDGDVSAAMLPKRYEELAATK